MDDFDLQGLLDQQSGYEPVSYDSGYTPDLSYLYDDSNSYMGDGSSYYLSPEEYSAYTSPISQYELGDFYGSTPVGLDFSTGDMLSTLSQFPSSTLGYNVPSYGSSVYPLLDTSFSSLGEKAASGDLDPNDLYRSTLLSTGDPAAAASIKREVEAAAEEKKLEDLMMPTYGQSMAAWAQDPRGTALLGNDLFKPAQSFKLDDGTVVGMLDSGADIQNPYDYLERNGNVFIVDNNTGQTVGYMDENLQPRSYQEARLSNNASSGYGNATSAKSATEKLKEAAASALARQAAAKEAYEKSGIGQATSGLKSALAVAQALTGKNKGATTTSRSNQGQSSSQSYQGGANRKTMFASGGSVSSGYNKGGLLSITEALLQAMKNHKGLIDGEAGGQDDVVDIKAAPGEYIMDAEAVSALGDGNNQEGARKLDEMRMNIRKHKRQGGLSSIPPKAKSPEQYMKKGK